VSAGVWFSPSAMMQAHDGVQWLRAGFQSTCKNYYRNIMLKESNVINISHYLL
jgi:hypothetical protein